MQFYEYVLPVSSNTLSSFECFMSIVAGFEYRIADRDYAQREERFVLGAQGGHVAGVTQI
jgi:hypothetical protein